MAGSVYPARHPMATSPRWRAQVRCEFGWITEMEADGQCNAIDLGLCYTKQLVAAKATTDLPYHVRRLARLSPSRAAPSQWRFSLQPIQPVVSVLWL